MDDCYWSESAVEKKRFQLICFYQINNCFIFFTCECVNHYALQLICEQTQNVGYILHGLDQHCIIY